MKKITKIEPNINSPYQYKKLKVAAYCRVSKDSSEQLSSLESQKIHYEKYIKQNPDWEFVDIYYDEGISGTKKEKRTGLFKMLSDCESRKIDLIVTKSISRFSRNTTQCLEMVRKLMDLNIFIHFEKENINTQSMESELLLSILSGLAENESTSISENNNWSVQRRFRNGTFKISYPPFGYQMNNGHMIINPSESEIVKHIFSLALAGKSSVAISKELNKINIPSRKGKLWSSEAVRNILKNEKYTGNAIFQKTYTDSNYNRHKNLGEKDMYYVENHHELIIEQDVFDAVNLLITQKAKEKNVEKNSNKYLQRYSFSSKIICNECGSKFKRRVHTSNSNKYIAWCCNKHLKDTSECSMLFIKDIDIKSAFITMINKLIFGHKFILKPMIMELQNQNSSDLLTEIDAIEIKIKNNIEQIQVITALMSKKYLEPGMFNKEKNMLEAERIKLIAEKENIVNSAKSSISKIEEVKSLYNFISKSKMITAFEDEIFERYVDKIIVYSRKEIGFELKCGINLKERLVR